MKALVGNSLGYGLRYSSCARVRQREVEAYVELVMDCSSSDFRLGASSFSSPRPEIKVVFQLALCEVCPWGKSP